MHKYAEKEVWNSTREKQDRHHAQQPAMDNLDGCVKKGENDYRQRTQDGTTRLHQQRGLHLDENNLGCSTSNSTLNNFEDVLILNPVAVIDMETIHTTPSTSLATDR